MPFWPNEIARNIISVLQIADPQMQATVVFFTLIGWFLSACVAGAALGLAAWGIFSAVRGTFRTMDDVLADEDYQ